MITASTDANERALIVRYRGFTFKRAFNASSMEPLMGKDCEIKPLGLPINLPEHCGLFSSEVKLITGLRNLKRHNVSKLCTKRP